jgi:transposase
MKKYTQFIGIDVSKAKLDACFLLNAQTKQYLHLVVTNNEKGFKQLLTKLRTLKQELSNTLFCFENTGFYSMPLSFFLASQKADFWSVPAIEIRRSKGLTRGKNDKADCLDICFYAYTHLHKLELTQLPKKEILQLQVLYTEREKLIRAIKLLQSTQEAASFLPKEVLKETLACNAKTVKMLRKAMAEIDRKMQQIIAANQPMKAQYELITSVPGVGPQTALYLLITTKAFTAFRNWRKLACHAGIAPFEYSSGSSIRGKTKVNHLANKKIKSLLHMCALNAKKWDEQLKQYYQRKIAEGKNPMSVMNAIRCKVISRVFATVQRGTPYVNTLKFVA